MGLEEGKESVRPAESEKQKKFVKKRCPAGLRERKEPVRPAESEKIEEIREKEVLGGSEREKRVRETRGERKNRINSRKRGARRV